LASIASRLRPRNLNQALGWLLASVMVPLLLGAIALLVVQWRQERELAQNHLTALAQTLIQSIDRELDHGRAQLEVIAASPMIDTRDWEQLHRFGADVASPSGTVIVLLGPDGQALLNTAVPWGQPLPNIWKLGDEKREVLWQGRSLPLSLEALTRQVFERGQVVYSDLFYGMHAQQPRLALAVPVIRQGKVVYALALSIPPALLEELIRSAVNAPGLRSLLVDRRGRVVAANAAASVRLGDVAMPIDVPPGSTAGNYELTARDGTPVRGAYAVSANNGFVVRASLERAFTPARATWPGWVALMLAVLGASIVLASWVGGRLAQPLRDLGQRAREGRPPSKEPASGIAEIEVLAQALRAGAEAEQQRRNEHALRVVAEQQEALVKHSEARLKRVLDQLFVFVGVLSLDGRVMEGNAVPTQRAGIRARDVIGKPFWDCHWWTHDAAVAQRVRNAVERAAQGQTLRFDIHGRFEGGGLLTVDLQLAPLRDEAGSITHVIASGVDVEARVQAMRELERSEARAVESARQFDAEHRMLEATLEAAPVGIAVTDPQGQLLQINQAGADLLGIAGAADRNLATRSLRGWPHAPGTQEPVQLPPDQWPLQQALARRHAVTNIIDIAPADNAVRRRTVLMSAAPVVDAAGHLIGGVVVEMDITQRVQAEASLRRADRQKDEFLATLAHELRNPLAPIRTSVELIRLRDPADAIVQRARVIIERQVMHLSRLVDDLLDVSRITMGTIQLRQETPDLGAIAVSAAEAVAPALEAAGLALEQQIGPRPVVVHGDGTRLAQCILNLLHNAVKFTPRGGHIVLRVAQEGPMAVVEVSDNGTGVSLDNLERIFELFVQERPSGVDGNTGLGIGLALTRKLVELHGGTVRAESAGLGQGTTVRISLPAAVAVSAGPLPRENVRPERGEGTRVLVVDDNRDAADTLGEMLSMSGFSVTVEYSGEAALSAVERDVPDAVLLDIGLPDIDGYEVCRRIRRSPVSSQPVLIALTGWGQDRDREVATAAGFNAHLTKPAEPDRIIALLKDLLPGSSPDPITPPKSIVSASSD
jgi:PAS domain S-box-containing protein